MEVWRILEEMGNGKGGLRNPNKFEELKKIVTALKRAGPVIGRILTRQGYFAGIIEEVGITETEFIFSIRNPGSPKEKRGKSSESSCNFLQSNWRRTIHLDLLQDIQVYQDREGNPLSLDALLSHNDSNN